MKRLASTLLILTSLIGVGLAQERVTVRPTDLAHSLDNLPGWRFGAEGVRIASSGRLAVGPGQPPIGGGSAAFELLDMTGGMSLQYFSSELVGLPLGSLTRLEYCTLVEAAGDNQAVSLQLNFDDDVTDWDTSYKGRLIFEPGRTPGEEITVGTWQCWDALAGYWWGSGSPLNSFQGFDNPGSLIEILSRFPNAGFNSEVGGLVLKADSGRGSFHGNADALTLGTSTFEVTFDFEQEPFDRAACYLGGWQNYGFPNQDQCTRFVNDRDSGGNPWAELDIPPVADPGATSRP